MDERRKGQHHAVHRLAQTSADLRYAAQDIEGMDVHDHHKERRHRALCLVRAAITAVTRVVDEDLGPKLITKDGA